MKSYLTFCRLRLCQSSLAHNSCLSSHDLLPNFLFLNGFIYLFEFLVCDLEIGQNHSGIKLRLNLLLMVPVNGS